ncbi:unnamed protein product [Heligmosomoides polygyrus]|uniref:MFS domain-containing protein n=1 Tax=Heligmosomoides polygyrus TaxID=6339 RepID=A0A3P8AY71_HELPZ|nr:unnamed protein product [Heligmosomoides polygyrus]
MLLYVIHFSSMATIVSVYAVVRQRESGDEQAFTRVFSRWLSDREAAKKGLTEFEIGVTFGIFELVIFLVSPVVGKLMPLFGPKNLFSMGLASTGLVSMLFGFIDSISKREAFFLASLTIRCLQGVGEAAFVTSSFTINANCFPEMLSTILGILQTCCGIGFSIGPFLGGILYGIGGFRLPFFCLSAIFFVMSIISRRLIPSDQESGLRTPGIQFHLSPPVLGLVFLLSGACFSVTAPLNGMLVERFKYRHVGMLVAPVAIIFALALTGPSPLLPLNKDLSLIIVGQVLFGSALSTLQIPTYRNTVEAAREQGFKDGTATYGLISGLIGAIHSMG